MREYRIGRLNGRFVVTWRDETGRRRRFRLDALTAKAAESEALDVIRRETLPIGRMTVADVWEAHRADRQGRPIAETMGYTGIPIKKHFGDLRPDQVTTEHCRSYSKARQKAGLSVGTVWTELGHLRSALKWAENTRLIAAAPYIDRPQKPTPKERFLTAAEIDRLIAADCEPHIKLAILLMLTTAGRVGAILDLKWERVDFDRGQINLRADLAGPRKGRAVVPMNNTLRAALTQAKEAAMSDFVVEWAGGPIKSIRKGFMRAVEAAGLEGVSPHVLRHTAAVHMAEGGIPMSEIAQFLGHSSTAVTERTYARFSPSHLRTAADILDFGKLRGVR